MPKSSIIKTIFKNNGRNRKRNRPRIHFQKKFAFLIAPENVARIHLFFHIGKAFVVAVGNDGF